MDLPGPIHDILVVFLGSVLILGGLGVVLFTNPIYSAFSLGLVLVCISLFYIPTNSYFVAAAQLLIYVGAINVLIIFSVMFMNGSECSNDSHLWTVGDGVTSLVCTSILFSLITTIPDTSWYGIIWSTRSNQIITTNYSIDSGVCIFCGNCVEYCPTNCLSMTEEYDLSTYDRHELNYNQIALGRLPMLVIGGYIIQIVLNSTQIKIDKDKPLDSRTITNY